MENSPKRLVANVLLGRKFLRATDIDEAQCLSKRKPVGYYDQELTKQRRDLKGIDFKTGGPPRTRHSRWPNSRNSCATTLWHFHCFHGSLGKSWPCCDGTGSAESAAQNTVAGNFGISHTSAARLNYYPAEDPVAAQEQDGLTPRACGVTPCRSRAITLLLKTITATSGRNQSTGWIDVPPKAGISWSTATCCRSGVMTDALLVFIGYYRCGQLKAATACRFSFNPK